MFRTSLAACVAVVMIAPLPAFSQGMAMRESFDIPVYPMDANTFEVVEKDGAGGTQLWCAAGIYARDTLGQRDGSLYILQGRGDSRAEPGRKSVIFTTQAVENAFSSVTQGVRRAGQVFTVSHAYALCRDTPRLRILVR
jgi:hypothetical protein